MSSSASALLQDAVFDNKMPFIRILMDSGFVSFLIVALVIDTIFGRWQSFCFRVDPNAVCEGNQDTPLKIAAKRGEDAQEVFEIFQEFTEIADKVKIFYMSVLMKSDKPKKAKEKFQSLLESLPVDLVRTFVGTYL